MELQLVFFAYVVDTNELYDVQFKHISRGCGRGEGICLGLKEVRIKIPEAVRKGDSAIFECLYDTEGDILYAVKWYKGRREFYRYTPNESPAIKTFPIGTLSVNKNESNANQVTVTGLDLDAAGTYSCEVSADAPSFHTAIVSANMNVVELPQNRPSIHGMKRKYRVGDILRGNCTSDGSKPAANLTWYINDHQPLSSQTRYYNPQDSNIADQQYSAIGVQFLVTPEHFATGKLKVRCSASIYELYWQSTEVSAEEDRPRVRNFEPAATIVGINYLQPPPNLQTGQRKPDGQADVKDIDSSAGRRKVLNMMFVLLIILQITLIR
ncbi:uncharacterized protein [Neodiprion pinetum]|uniref:Uncharacterized protein LOC107217526 isoform X1 n=1 Tax=Neodiprion lecontei TaxID=441921 RepID=A0ABM3FQG3_NEOLC|nr:uncharacterized protein LOC124178779 isoform X1 [Neodiprion fabricii]XP_046472710.1 uncharacterized protein LOC124214476 isoform X1 [Neodiprion pinetum]XP_046590245.1 uncharacterized protein LOC107217526 isoform X1 [Neodiprion lecontei]XP_046610486.1 uncharacterized protein LOC124300432 isoform X1 [Neodiprion virginianus]